MQHQPDPRRAALLQQVRAQLGGVAGSPAAALAILPGRAKNLAMSARQRISRGTFPFPIRRIGRHNTVLAADIVDTLLGAEARAPVLQQHPRRRGRPAASISVEGD